MIHYIVIISIYMESAEQVVGDCFLLLQFLESSCVFQVKVGEGIDAFYAAPNPFLLNKTCLNQVKVELNSENGGCIRLQYS